MNNVQITLLGKPGCHLCDDARAIIVDVLDGFDSPNRPIFEELSILDDEQLYERYWEEIPVVLINGKVHDFWRVNPERLSAAITEAQGV